MPSDFENFQYYFEILKPKNFRPANLPSRNSGFPYGQLHKVQPLRAPHFSGRLFSAIVKEYFRFFRQIRSKCGEYIAGEEGEKVKIKNLILAARCPCLRRDYKEKLLHLIFRKEDSITRLWKKNRRPGKYFIIQ